MKRFLVILLLSSVLGIQDTLPTMSILNLESSVILTDSEGEKLSISTLSYTSHFEIIPITNNSFLIWSGPYENKIN
tara:strand:- start:416 stop:643 length:228 start_codon:yes stop_codon:yes gene_type:complete